MLCRKALLSCLVIPAGAIVVGLAPPSVTQGPSDLSARINDALGLRASTVLTVELDTTPGVPVVAAVSIEGLPQVLLLEPHSVRSDGFRVLAQQADGSLIEADPGPVRTLRGSIVGVDGSVVAGSMQPAGLYARITYADGSEFWLEPVGSRVPGAAANDYALYAGDAVIETGSTCAATLEQHGIDVVAADGYQQTGAGGGNCVAQLACDADFEYYQDHGSSVPGTVSQIETVINTMNPQYESEVGITHTITTIIVRSSSNDPYTKKKANQLLNEFRNEWESNQSGVVRDVAQLFTGKDLAGTTIGVAWIGAVCTNFGYSLVESDFAGTGNLACQTDLSAHELGHNWGADHCSCSTYTMNPGITCANRFHPTFTIPEIIAHRDSRTCLDSCGGGQDPTGACCFADESCVVDTAAGCAAAVGAYEGDGTSCTPNPCLTGGPAEAPVTSGTVNKGTLVSGFLEDLFDSDNGYVVIDAQKQGNKYRAELRTFCTSPYASISQMDVTTEVGANASGITTTISLRNYSTNKWDVIDSYGQPQGDTIRVNANVANPGSYVNAADGEVTVRIETLKNGGDYIIEVDHVEVIVTP